MTHLTELQPTFPARALARTIPAGSVFATAQQVTFTATPPPASRPDNAADPYAVYGRVPPLTIEFPAGSIGVISFPFTITYAGDRFDHADFPVVFTATAQPSGVTASATLTLVDNDISIRTSEATVSVRQGETATYTVQLSEQPPVSAAVSVVSHAAAATVSPATLTFTTANWNIPQPVTVTGVAAGSTTIRHSSPDNTVTESRV